VTIAVLKAVALALREAPGLNSHIAFGRFVPRDRIDIACLVALDDGKDLANAKIVNADCKTLATISSEIKAKAEKLRAHQDEDFEKSKPLMALLPVPLLDVIVSLVGYLSGSLGLNIPALGVRPFPFGSAMVTSVGMLGLEQAFVPFTPFARVPLLFMVGEVTKRAVVGAKDAIIVQRMLTITGTLDHRFADGTEAAKLSKKLKFVLENPSLLDETASHSSGEEKKSRK
jgi:pyruvate/2-oxoglutarate dehydrogenase complex dihydrolipoamide acyltransferase (E2) component